MLLLSIGLPWPQILVPRGFCQGAQLSNFNQYATPNAASREVINPADLKDSAIYPTDEQMKVLEFVKDLGAKGPWYDELWTSIKSK